MSSFEQPLHFFMEAACWLANAGKAIFCSHSHVVTGDAAGGARQARGCREAHTEARGGRARLPDAAQAPGAPQLQAKRPSHRDYYVAAKQTLMWSTPRGACEHHVSYHNMASVFTTWLLQACSRNACTRQAPYATPQHVSSSDNALVHGGLCGAWFAFAWASLREPRV